VSGPAAGLTMIVANAIITLGSFQGFLVAVILAGFIDPLFAKVFNYSLLLDSTPTFLILSLALAPYIYYEINKLKI
jgi:hypothetical protein